LKTSAANPVPHGKKVVKEELKKAGSKASFAGGSMNYMKLEKESLLMLEAGHSMSSSKGMSQEQ